MLSLPALILLLGYRQRKHLERAGLASARRTFPLLPRCAGDPNHPASSAEPESRRELSRCPVGTVLQHKGHPQSAPGPGGAQALVPSLALSHRRRGRRGWICALSAALATQDGAHLASAAHLTCR